ncbi:MAG: LysM peptidoglycan-binding domain-containing protein [Erysipelotrichaceae bacterium]|nr:LysM peptidoglycan-binding domain-containing protein [Erysipelotrichaceae bacterium]MBE6147870.1 LysM peptidoglycan-binding domain-containing protein [Bacillota bacterium]
MKSKSIVNLYVVQKGDTIDSIIKKFNMSKEVFYRYNKMTKYVPLVENQPLHIISFYEEQIIEMDLENEKLSLALTSIAHLFKEGYASILYFPENFSIVKRNLLYQNTILVDEFTTLSKDEKAKVVEILESISSKLFSIIPILQSSNKEILTEYKKELNSLLEEFDNLIIKYDSSVNVDLLKTTFRDISSLVIKLSIKLFTKDYYEADIVFNELLSKIEIINKLGILK